MNRADHRITTTNQHLTSTDTKDSSHGECGGGIELRKREKDKREKEKREKERKGEREKEKERKERERDKRRGRKNVDVAAQRKDRWERERERERKERAREEGERMSTLPHKEADEERALSADAIEDKDRDYDAGQVGDVEEHKPESIITSDCKRQSASHTHGYDVERVT